MNWYRNVSRREFIRIAAATAAASGTVSCTSARSPWRFLRVDEARTLAAICDQLIPPDADPGAEWACVVNFIDLQLCGPYRALRSTYRDGIAHMDEMGRVQFGKVFAESSGDEQIRLLIALEKGEAPKDIWKTVSPKGSSRSSWPTPCRGSTEIHGTEGIGIEPAGRWLGSPIHRCGVDCTTT